MQHRRVLESRPIPDDLWRFTLARFPFLGARNEDDLGLLRQMTTLFLAEKEFTGTQGLVVSDEMAVAIAAQACLPALKLGMEWLKGFVGIVVHEDAVIARREVEDDDGIVHSYDEELSGEAMQGGPVMLAWRDVDAAGASAADGYNVVVHEFAHVIDMQGGVTSGTRTPIPNRTRGRWLEALTAEYEQFVAALDAGEETFLDPYGGQSIEEFFAVGAEAFFVAPEELELEHPQLYSLLQDFFRQDPAGWNRAPAARPSMP